MQGQSQQLEHDPLSRAQWDLLAGELVQPGAKIRSLALEEVVNMASESTFSFAKTICSVGRRGKSSRSRKP